MYIERALEQLVLRHSAFHKVVVVTGPRQVGKTTMLKHLMEIERADGIDRSYVTLDDSNARNLAKDDPALFLQRYRPPILIDEIQKAPELLPYIKIAVDEGVGNGLFWLTGSQPFHLMRAVSESLAGRASIIEMLGLSNAEIDGSPTKPFDPGCDDPVERVRQRKPFGLDEAYGRIHAGSLPAIRALPEDMRASAFESYLDTYIMRDIRDLASVADEQKFRRFVTACAALTSKPVVYAELARLADVDEKTAKSWLSLLESSYLVKVVQPYSNNLLKRLSKQPIMHFLDTGLAAYLAGWSDARTLERGAMSGQIFETFVFGELYKSYVNSGKRPPLFFFRNNDKKEIDILIERDGSVFPVEVKKTASPTKADTRNFGAIDPLESPDAPPELASLKRHIGRGHVICLCDDTYPISSNTWAFPIWAV